MKLLISLVLGAFVMAAALAALEPEPQFGDRHVGDYPAVPEPFIFWAALIQDPPRHDKYRDDPHAACVTPQVAEYYKNPSLHACTCTLKCEMGAGGYMEQMENPACELWCTKERCGCHPEEPCDAPDVLGAPKR
jgi:hypothetical protein